ncbi:DNA-binding transcriptional regulator YhcF (GntR family) [Arcicella rosea]|uniref:GntR family transcriptional regulator n=1 Tax=Arcicella rosea TaxID=502909 RepID=UPI00345D3F53
MNNSKAFLDTIVIDELSSTPKYQQLVNLVIDAVKSGILKVGDGMPSINEVSFTTDMSRLTVEKGYNELRKLGFLVANRGKGYFISNTDIFQDLKILLMFNKLSTHKKIIYDSFVQALGEKASIDFYVYNNDSKFFCKILGNRKHIYTHYVIIPHFIEGEESAYQLINTIPKNKLILVDKLIPGITGNFASVYENFTKDIYHALFQATNALEKYSKLKLIFPENSFYPEEIITGFKDFCMNFAFENKVVYDLTNEIIEVGDVYINVMEDDLFELIERIDSNGFLIGTDVGIISYNETRAKKYIMNGLTTISTDFEAMGKTTARLILDNSKKQIQNPFNIVFRDSLK